MKYLQNRTIFIPSYTMDKIKQLTSLRDPKLTQSELIRYIVFHQLQKEIEIEEAGLSEDFIRASFNLPHEWIERIEKLNSFNNPTQFIRYAIKVFIDQSDDILEKVLEEFQDPAKLESRKIEENSEMEKSDTFKNHHSNSDSEILEDPQSTLPKFKFGEMEKSEFGCHMQICFQE